MKFGETKGTKGLLKLPTFDFAMLIFGDIRPQQYPETHSKYGNLRRDDTSLRRNARPVMHWLLWRYICVSTPCPEKKVPLYFCL